MRRQRDAPVALAHRDLTIAQPVTGSPWPLGTRRAKIATDREMPASTGESEIHLIRLPASPESSDTRGNLLSVRFLVAPGGNLRDLQDAGVDLLATRDSTAVNYAAALPQFVSVPLAWRRTHVLLTPGPALTPRTVSGEHREMLARDAIRGEARGAL